MYIKRLLKTTTSIQTKYLTSAPKFVPAYDKMNQSGRSMIEMLGVLAIIGVLSVGGLAAYEAAVKRIEANNVFYDITTMKTRMETARLAALDAMPFAPNGPLNGMTAVYNNGRIDVTVPNVPFEICELLLDKTTESETESETEIPTIEVSPENCVKDGLTTMLFSFAPEGGGRYALPISRVEPDTGGNTGGSTGGETGGNTGGGDGGESGGSTGGNTGGESGGSTGGSTDDVPCVNGEWSAVEQKCTCYEPWAGKACQKCSLSCVNGTPNSTCTQCDCEIGWGGENCDTCNMTCVHGYSDSACTKCSCQGNWTGPRCNECSLYCGTKTQGYDNTTCTACECVGYWTGSTCSECSLNCGTDTQGSPDADCTACICKEPWKGDDCTECGLKQEDCPADKPKLDTDTCACVACPADAPNWTGSECVSCALECQNGGTLDLAACSCSCPSPWAGEDCSECAVGSDGKQMVLVNGTCVNYSSVCGSTIGTCNAHCPDSCTIPASLIEEYIQYYNRGATPITCENGMCYCTFHEYGGTYFIYTLQNGNWINEDCSSVDDGSHWYNYCGGNSSNCDIDETMICYHGNHAYIMDSENPINSYHRSGGSMGGCVYCYAAGTMISLADGTCKRVEDIDYDDELLVWDFDNGCFSSAKPLFIKVAQESSSYNLLRFSDGSELKTIHQHRIFNIEAGKFTYPMTDDTPLGTHTFNANGEIVSLVSKEVIKKPVEYYNIITKHHLNCFANGILTSCRLNNMYPIRCMKFVKDDRTMLSDTDFPLLPAEWIDGLRLKEQPTDINRDGNVNFKDKSVQDYALRLMNVDKKFVAGKKEAA